MPINLPRQRLRRVLRALRRTLHLVVCACMCSSSALATDLDTQIDRIQHTYQGLADLRADFTQTTFVKALGKTVDNHGVLSLQKPGKLRIDYQGTPARQFISNGKVLWIATPGDPQVIKEKVGKAGISKEALAFLGGFGALRTLFTIEPGVGGKRGDALVLRPKERTTYEQLDARFDARGLLTELVVHNTSGGTATYRFTNIQPNPGLPAALFQYP